MKIVLAPDKFKSCMTSPEICRIMSEVFRETIPGVEIISLPMADGGDGTVRTLAYAMNAEIRTKKVCGPLGDDVVAEYGADCSGCK